MEFNKELYQRAFSRVKASPEKIQEVIDMTENRRTKRIARKMLVAVAVTALAVLTAMGANAATGGQLFARIVSYTESADGSTAEMVIEIDDGAEGGGQVQEFTLYEAGDDGKATMQYWDENGKEVRQEIDLDQVPSAQPPVLRLNGKKAAVTSAELDQGKGTATIRYMDGDGKEASAVLVLPEDCRDFESLNQLLAEKGTICGQTQAGEDYEISQVNMK